MKKSPGNLIELRELQALKKGGRPCAGFIDNKKGRPPYLLT